MIIVLGTPRSGTSAVAGILHRLGVTMTLDEEKEPGWEYNRYEDQEFGSFSDYVTGKVHFNWTQIVNNDNAPPTIATEFDRFARLIQSRNEQFGDSWGWKHPNTIWYIKYFYHLVPNAQYVWVKRQKEATIDSLVRMTEDHPEAYTIEYTVGALTRDHHYIAFATYNRMLFDFFSKSDVWWTALFYEELLEDTSGTIGRLIADLDIDPTVEQKKSAIDFVEDWKDEKRRSVHDVH